MNIEKNKTAYIYTHVDRSFTGEGEYAGDSDIDETKSADNYNLSANNRHRKEQIAYIKSQTGRRPRKNQVESFTVIVTLPKKYRILRPKEIKHFFKDAYESFKSYFNVTENDIASSWVHVDEQAPHMHFVATPIVRDTEGARLCYADKVPRLMYQELHPAIEAMMEEKGWQSPELASGITKGRSFSVKELKEGALEARNELERAREANAKVKAETKALKDELLSLKDRAPTIKAFIELCLRNMRRVLELIARDARISKRDRDEAIALAARLNTDMTDKGYTEDKDEQAIQDNKAAGLSDEKDRA